MGSGLESILQMVVMWMDCIVRVWSVEWGVVLDERCFEGLIERGGVLYGEGVLWARSIHLKMLQWYKHGAAYN